MAFLRPYEPDDEPGVAEEWNLAVGQFTFTHQTIARQGL
jgi:hypothetical protein